MTSRFITIILTFTVLVNTGCGVDKANLTIIKNDTTEIFKTLIDSAFYMQRLPDFSRLKHNNPFGDTIIFKFDSILVGDLPSNLKYKILTQDQICSLATQYQNDTTDFCNFLQLSRFKKIDTTIFEVSLQNQCVSALYKKDGARRFDENFYKERQGINCQFGFMCGGGIGMTFYKQADSLKGTIQALWSD